MSRLKKSRWVLKESTREATRTFSRLLVKCQLNWCSVCDSESRLRKWSFDGIDLGFYGRQKISYHFMAVMRLGKTCFKSVTNRLNTSILSPRLQRMHRLQVNVMMKMIIRFTKLWIWHEGLLRFLYKTFQRQNGFQALCSTWL